MNRFGSFVASAAAGALFVLAIPLTGLLDQAASPGSNALIDWFGQTAARQSITLRSLTTTVPDLDDPAMVLRGAGHYQLVCTACHGSPGEPAQQFAQTLSPAPPPLTRWRPDARLFQTIKYGIRHTAMPAWPTDLRDDEVWDMVAFLRLLRTMDAETYIALAYNSAEPGTCAVCHGAEGKGRGGAFPRLDIQNRQYIVDALVAFRDGTRLSGTMMSVARQLTDNEIEQLAAHFGKAVALPVKGGNERGKQIAQQGILARDIPACDSCHNDQTRLQFPRLAGQSADYLRRQLELFQKYGAARGGRYAHIMAKVVEDHQEGAHRLEPEDIEAVADHYGW